MPILFEKILTGLLLPAGFIAALGLAALVLWLFRRRRTAGLAVAAAFIAFLAFSNPWVSNWLIGSLESQHPATSAAESPAADIATLLGGSVRLRAPPLRPVADLTDAADRIWHASLLYKAGKVKTILVIGGNVFEGSGRPSESSEVALILRDWGVAASAIIIEESSRNTYENAVAAKQIFEDKGFRSSLLVTSASHMPRAYRTFMKAGLPVIASPADIQAVNSQFDVFDVLPDGMAFQKSTLAVKEWVGIAYYRLLGRL